jgi:acyl-coenzyme A thioesterase PaaI-like protein
MTTLDVMKNIKDFHKECFACGQTIEGGLQLQFEVDEHQVICHTSINKLHQGYGGVVHGGIIATLLDAAMVRCLHDRFGQSPLTCRLDIRFIKSIPVETEILIEASPIRHWGNMSWAESVIKCHGDIFAKGRGTFKLINNTNSDLRQ